MEMDLFSFSNDPWLLNCPLIDDESLCKPLQPSPSVHLGRTSSELLHWTDDLEFRDGHTRGGVPATVPVPEKDDEAAGNFKGPPDSSVGANRGADVYTTGEFVQKDFSTETVADGPRTFLHGPMPTTSCEPQEIDERLCSNDTQEIQLRRSSRVKTIPERSLNYQRDTSVKVFQSALASHKRHVTLCKNVVSEGNFDVKVLTNSRNKLEECIVSLSNAFHRMIEIDPEKYVQFIDVINEREAVNLQTLHEVTRCLRYVDTDHVTTFSGSYIKGSAVHSGKSKGSKSKSHRSSNSSRSHSSATVMRAEAIANAAALKAKLQFHNEEVKHKASLERLTIIKNLAVEEAKIAALDGESNSQTEIRDSPKKGLVDRRLQCSNDECNSSVVQGIMQTSNINREVNSNFVNVSSQTVDHMRDSSVVHSVRNRDQIQTLPNSVSNFCPSHNNPPSPAMFHTFCLEGGPSENIGVKRHSTVCDNFQSPEIHFKQTQIVSSVESPSNENATIPIHGSKLNCNVPEFVPPCAQAQNVAPDINFPGDFFKSLSEMMYMNRIPLPEPGVFTGDPLKYPAWKNTFLALVKNIHPTERIHLLKKYLGGDALKCVASLLMIPSTDSYDEVMSMIDKRYGDTYSIACAFKSKIEHWPKIQSRDSLGLREFSDFLKQCEVAARNNLSLRVLDDDIHNRTMLQKLPDWLISKWSREVYRSREETQSYPSFSKFVGFLSREADIACQPATMLKKSHSANSTDKNSGQHQPKSNSFVHNTVKATTHCLFCNKDNHSLDQCFKFKSKPMDERKAYIVEKRLCFGCLLKGHASKSCKKRLQCAECKKRHPTPLHGDVKDKPFAKSQNAAESNESNKQRSVTTRTDPQPASTQSRDNISLMTFDKYTSKSTMIVPVYISHSSNANREILTYALLDMQSDTSFITNALLCNLGVNGVQTSLLLSTMTSDNQLVSCQRATGFSVRAFNKDNKLVLPALYSKDRIPANDDCIPSIEIADRWPYLRSVASQLMPRSDCGVGLLIGYNCPQALIPREVIPPENNGPFGMSTDLGFGIIGLTYADEAESAHICSFATGSSIVLRTSSKEILSPVQVSQFFDREEIHVKGKPMSQDDLKFLSMMQSQIHRTSDGHYEMPLPLKDLNTPPAPNNKPLALQRLTALVKRFKRDPEHFKLYSNFMNDLLEKGYAERVPEADLNPSTPAYYLPHHGVYNPSKPGKVRVVMDGSAKFHGKSLNDHLLAGPDLMNNLTGVLCRFRKERVAFTCDIQGMFQQFYVNAEHRNFLRFFWFDDGNYDSHPVEFRSTVHLFGAVSSPAVANFGLKKAALDHEDEFGSDVRHFIHNDFYVDDGLTSVSTVDKAESLISRSKALCASGGLKLHKFVSNSRKLLQTTSPEDRADTIKILDLHKDDLPLERALGVKWCVESDTFKFNIVVKEYALTRRGVLGTVCSIFDPLGLIAPVVLQGKRILQSLCRDKLDWDDPIPESIRTHWERWLYDLRFLESSEINRCYKPAHFGEIDVCELHCFADASMNGYGTCAYLRLKDTEGNVNCSLVMAKSRVAPLKSTTIPRLELSAALVCSELGSFLQTELAFPNMQQVFWTDSKIALGFIANDSKRFQVYVANRVQKIRNCSNVSQWYHVKTIDNPADIVSRGCTGKELQNSMWFQGPNFLWNSHIEYVRDEVAVEELPSSEIKRSSCLANTANEDPLQHFQRFSSWKRIVDVLARCFRFVENLKSKSRSKVVVEDQVKAENWLMTQMQQSSFASEIQALRKGKNVTKGSRLSKLDPFMNDDGLIRVGGRIRHSTLPFDLKHPIVLPKDHFLTHLLVRHHHELAGHQGKGMTINEVRSNGLWIIGLNTLVSSLIYKCVTCRRHRHTPRGQKMNDLPEERTEPSPAFTHVAVDYFGPFYIRDGRKEAKRYGVLFTCLSSRAVHIETAVSLDTDSFINALRRFLSLRGPMRTLRSDRGSNIVSGIKHLQNTTKPEIDDDAIAKFLLSNKCDYILNVPNASHQGGVWERQIRSIRSVLNPMLHNQGHQLNDEGFRTLMMEVANIVNSRPLTVTNLNDPCSLQPLTPNNLLTMKSNVLLPPPGNFQNADLYSKRLWRRVQHLADEFWQRWRKEFLFQLNSRSKWNSKKRNFETDDIVLIVDDSLPRCFWKLAKVTEVYPSKDGLVRKVKLQLGNPSQGHKFLERPIHKLILLVESK